MFRLRQVSQRISGGEIVRESVLGAGPVRIGRGTDCDVHVPDLAVPLFQATLSAGNAGSVLLEWAEGPPPALIDGQPARAGPLALDRDRQMALGRWQLTMAADPAQRGDILLTLEQRADRGETEPERVTPPLGGRRAAAWALVVFVLVAFIGWPVVSHALRPLPPTAETADALADEPHFRVSGLRADASWTSGPLSGVHAALAGDCKACHQQPFMSVTDATCRSCHVSAHDHAEPARLLQTMAAPPPAIATARAIASLPPGRCTVCHTEHEGPVLLSNPATSDCAACHGALDAALPDTGLLNASDWREDHPQFRPLVVAGFAAGVPHLRRVSLEARPEDLNGLRFSHAQHLSRSNAVARMAGRLPAYGQPLACADCHRAAENRAAAGFLAIEMERDCGACHSLAVADARGRVIDLPHAEPDKVVAVMLGLIPSPAPRPAVAGAPRAIPGPGPARVGAGPGAVARARMPFLRGGACYDCHEIRPETAPGRLDFVVAPVHLQSRFMLRSQFPHDRHEEQDCADCHAAADSARAEDLLLPAIATCRECHGNPQWAARHPNSNAEGSCATCHWYHPDSRAPAFRELERSVRGGQTASR